MAARATAAPAFAMPAPQPREQAAPPNPCAVCCRYCRTCAGVSAGLAASISATIADTCGVAMLVPEYCAYAGWDGTVVPVLSVEIIETPGAAISTDAP